MSDETVNPKYIDSVYKDITIRSVDLLKILEDHHDNDNTFDVHTHTLIKCETGESQAENENILAILLLAEVVFLNTAWYKKDWPEEARRSIRILVNSSDIFAWGCADAEEIELKDLPELFEYYMKDPSWGAAVWCIKDSNYYPQKPVYDAIMKAGIWNLDEMGLRGYEEQIGKYIK